MDSLDDQILQLWGLLNQYQVNYLVVGGFAVNLHGFHRATSDLDIWIEDSAENRQKLCETLFEAGLGDRKEIESGLFMPGFDHFLLKDGFELDIETFIDGFSPGDFEACYKLAPTAIIEEVPVKFLHINHLIESKKAGGGIKDLQDAMELEKILNSRKF